MPMTMSKLMNLGMPLNEAIFRSTVEPARVIDRPELGALSPGAEADVAVFELEKGDFGFIDSGLASMRGTQRLLAHMTIRTGEVVWDLNGITRPDWASQGEYIRLD